MGGFFTWKMIFTRLEASGCQCQKAGMQYGGNMDPCCWPPQAKQLQHPHSSLQGWRAHRKLQVQHLHTPRRLGHLNATGACNRLFFSLAASGQYFRSDLLSRHSMLPHGTTEEDWEQSEENRLAQAFSSFFKSNTLCSLHQHPHKNAQSVLHLRSWLLKKIQNAIKTWILLSFTSLCNFIIVSSINFERIVILASAGSPPPLLSQLFRSPVPASHHPTTDAVRKRRGGSKHGVEGGQQGIPGMGATPRRSHFFLRAATATYSAWRSPQTCSPQNTHAKYREQGCVRV